MPHNLGEINLFFPRAYQTRMDGQFLIPLVFLVFLNSEGLTVSFVYILCFLLFFIKITDKNTKITIFMKIHPILFKLK